MSYSSKSTCIITLVEVKAIQTNVLAKGLKVSKVQVKVNKTHIFTSMLWVDQDDRRVRYSAFFS